MNKLSVLVSALTVCCSVIEVEYSIYNLYLLLGIQSATLSYKRGMFDWQLPFANTNVILSMFKHRNMWTVHKCNTFEHCINAVFGKHYCVYNLYKFIFCQFCKAPTLHTCIDGEHSMTRIGSRFIHKCACIGPMKHVSVSVNDDKQLMYTCVLVCVSTKQTCSYIKMIF
jgi:hypothetical protein